MPSSIFYVLSALPYANQHSQSTKANESVKKYHFPLKPPALKRIQLISDVQCPQQTAVVSSMQMFIFGHKKISMKHFKTDEKQ